MNINLARENILYCFRSITGWRVELEEIDLFHFEIPAFYHNMYDFLLVKKVKADFVVVIVKSDESVIDIAKRKAYFEGAFKKDVVFYFDELSFRTRKRLSARKINFIYADQYLFVPFLGIFETRTFQETLDTAVALELNLSGERIILAYLNNLITSGDNGKEISAKLNLSPMSISNGLKDLELAGYCDLIQNGTAKEVKFSDKKNLWVRIENKLNSPVERVIYVAKPPSGSLLSGFSALSQKTLLADTDIATYAIHGKEYKSKKDTLKALPEGEGAKLEIWKWNPALFTDDETVDPFSLALSLKAEKDERVLMAIDEMIKEALG